MTAEQFLHNASVRQWDCIVFSEMLYYCRNPRAVIIGFSKLLRPDGVHRNLDLPEARYMERPSRALDDQCQVHETR